MVADSVDRFFPLCKGHQSVFPQFITLQIDYCHTVNDRPRATQPPCAWHGVARCWPPSRLRVSRIIRDRTMQWILRESISNC